jgi:hypothetical protein
MLLHSQYLKSRDTVLLRSKHVNLFKEIPMLKHIPASLCVERREGEGEAEGEAEREGEGEGEEEGKGGRREGGGEGGGE